MFCLEVLSIFRWVTVLGLVIAWMAPIVVFSFWLWHRKTSGERIVLPTFQFPNSWWNRLILLIICGVLIITVLVAWITPPQTWDSLTYHLSRVAHWAQNRSIWHYATGIDRQTSMPPGAEEIVLNFYVLTQSDRLASFPQWFSMLGSLIGVSLIAYYLGAKSNGQWLAAGFAATIPMGIVESSSTINDYVATFWVVCVVVECLAYYKNGENRSLMYISLAAGLAILTKPIVVPFLIPYAIALGFLLVKRNGLVTALKWGGVALIVIGLINGGYLTRNYITYGALSNPVDFETHSNQLRNVRGVLSTLIKNAGMHAGLPYLQGVNNEWNLLILKAHIKLGLEIQDPRTTAVGVFHVSPPSTQEDLVSNPYHAYLILVLVILMFVMVKKQGWSLIVYGLLTISTFILFSYIYKWNGFGTRYHLPFFVLFAPIAGVISGSFDKIKLGYLVALLLLIGSYPWIFSIDSRPLIPKLGRSILQSSILNVSRENLYFANSDLHDTYKQITDEIKSIGCSDIGIMLHGDDPEYLLWVLLGAPRSSLNIEWIVSSPTTRYEQLDFEPCAVICKDCGMNQNIRGNSFTEQFGDLQLFLFP